MSAHGSRATRSGHCQQQQFSSRTSGSKPCIGAVITLLLLTLPRSLCWHENRSRLLWWLAGAGAAPALAHKLLCVLAGAALGVSADVPLPCACLSGIPLTVSFITSRPSSAQTQWSSPSRWPFKGVAVARASHTTTSGAGRSQVVTRWLQWFVGSSQVIRQGLPWFVGGG